jgi:hypothetical protein
MAALMQPQQVPKNIPEPGKRNLKTPAILAGIEDFEP